MEFLIGSILVIILLVGLFFIVKTRKEAKSSGDQISMPQESSPDPECCGAHEVCEVDLMKRANPNIVEYFDDENLDQYRGMPEDRYTDNQIDEFREVLYSLQKKEIQDWLLSLSRREIELPSILHDEARQLILE